MHWRVTQGDVLTTAADVLICTANPWLNLSGGINGAVLQAGGESIQRELHAQLKTAGARQVPPGSIVRSGAGPLPFQHILHAVAIDVFYASSMEIVRQTFANAMTRAIELGAQSIASPTLATGYGPLRIREFGQAISPVLHELQAECELTLVVRRAEHVRELEESLERQ
ncbi:MAG: macro domain-containing protein [Planctomycetales bacterium]|nr:macro domain-containing protein [Planctomycetales bacterium]